MAPERLRILAVEDEAMIAIELENMLADLGHEVIGPASTVDAALALLQETTPDAAVLDANLAGRSAQPIVEALTDAGVPMVLASGYEARELQNLQISGVLVSKPYTERDLAGAIAKVFAARAG